MRIVGVDPGEKRIGVAVSDATGMIANPIGTIHHTSRKGDAEAILKVVSDTSSDMIVLGQSLDDEGNVTSSGLRAFRLAEEIRSLSKIPVTLIDEYKSTNEAKEAAIEMGLSRKKRKGHRDAIAAVIILQRYLDQIR